MSFTTTRRVEFRDTDAAGIVHFSVFFTMMEAAEHAMLRALGLSVHPPDSGSPTSGNQPASSGSDPSGAAAVTWPRVAASCDYTSVARFEDELTISVQVARIGTTSVQYLVRFTRDGEMIAQGTMTSVCCRLLPHSTGGVGDGGSGAGRRLEKTPIPDSIRELLIRHLVSQTISDEPT